MLPKDPIPCMAPKLENLPLAQELQAIFQEFLHADSYILGKNVTAFEENFANYIGTNFALGTASGTDSLILSLKALDIGVGDEVITTAHTALATIASIVAVGATPVLIDINPATFNIDVTKIAENITNKTKAIIAVHIYGASVELDLIQDICRAKNLYLIEDCAQACGGNYHAKKLGSIGDIGCFSFYPTKNLGALGDAGAITTNDTKIYDKLVKLRQYGWNKDRVSDIPGINSRLDELQAAILNLKLTKLDEYNAKRIAIAKVYQEVLFSNNNIELPEIKTDNSHVYHLFVIKYDKRDELLAELLKNSIQCGIHYPIAAHMQPGYKNLVSYKDLSVTEELCGKILSLPIYIALELEKVKEIAAIINKLTTH